MVVLLQGSCVPVKGMSGGDGRGGLCCGAEAASRADGARRCEGNLLPLSYSRKRWVLGGREKGCWIAQSTRDGAHLDIKEMRGRGDRDMGDQPLV